MVVASATMRARPLLVLLLLALGTSTAHSAPAKRRKTTATEREARAFVEQMTALLQPVSTVSSEAEWVASTDVTPDHTGERAGAEKTAAALSGSKLIIEKAKAYLAKEGELDELTARQLHKLLLSAAETPGTIPEVVARRIEAEGRQASIQDGYTFCLQQSGGRCVRPVSANDIDDLLRKSRNLGEREQAWRASKEIGRPLKAGLVTLQGLRNQVAKEMGYSSFFALQVADYGMTVPEMMSLLDATLETTKPIFDGLHCWAKNALAARYKKPVPKLIPAHWIGNRWAQAWPGLVEGTTLDPLFVGKTREFIVRTAEDFYVSLGFPRLPDNFWKKSDLYPVEKNSPRKKNAHASAWHIDGERDVRSLMSVEPDEQWFGTAHHELGHIYYYLSYARPEVPFLLRTGANRAFHEAVGELARLASEQTPYLKHIGILRGNGPEPMGWLLQSALDAIVFLPFSAGTMSHFEHDLYETPLAAADWQSRWWEYVARYQGVEPPAPRPPELCDACTKTHINDDPAQYYDYALATLIKFQLHDHICTKILKQDVRACDYSGSAEVGKFLKGILSLGATRDWRTVIKEATGEEIGPRALLAFYQPLVDELAKRNAGKDCTR
jgi:peptidyl-dipeptidase A